MGKIGIIGLVAIIGLAVAVYNFIVSNIFVIAAIGVVVIGAIWSYKAWMANQIKKKEDILMDKVFEICNTYEVQLATERFKTKRVDAYNNISHDRWYEKELDLFYENVLLRDLSDETWYFNEHPSFRARVLDRVDQFAREKEEEKFDGNTLTQDMDGHSYEAMVAELLAQRGYSVHLTKTTGDQGVDIIAKKEGLVFAVQCKRYSRTVGNAAVQEVIAGMKFYGADFGAVVTNSQFSQSAHDLANVSSILLLHDSELDRLESLIRD